MVKFSSENLPSTSTIISTLGTVTATVLLLRTIAVDLVPSSLSLSLKKLSDRLSSTLTVVVEESDGLTPNHLFRAANTYLSTKISSSTRRIKANNVEKDNKLVVTVDKNQEIVVVYSGVKLAWVLCSVPVNENNPDRNSNTKTELRFFELSFNKKHKDLILKSYLPYVLSKSKEIDEHTKAVRLHTVDYNGTDYWGSVVLNHPATFDTMAMESEKKREIVDDLDAFVSRREKYRRVGKAWKRGYLLYGPPGTGKSSLVAAIANYLKFDVYDLDLREVQCNSDLRRLLIGSGNRSILVIEDIDCNVGVLSRDGEGNNRAAEDDKITLSGLLNFIDGLWSSCGDEKIIIFTTNHKDRLDEALLRPGRMDMHIHMSYCTFDGFKTLAYNYLRIENHPLFRAVEELLTNVNVTPAEIAGELMKNESADIALPNIMKFLVEKDHGQVGS